MGTFRLLLSWLVIACHCVGYTSYFQVDSGTVAVATFFFISGFLMPLAFETNYHYADFKERYKFYFINRLLRIYPLYWISLLIVVVPHFILYFKTGFINERYSSMSNEIQNWLLLGLNQSHVWGHYLRFNNPAWTLDVELQYYLLAPLLLLLWMKAHRICLGLLCCIALISVYLLWKPVNLVDIDRSLLAWSALFILGFVFFKMNRLQRIFFHRTALLCILPCIAIYYFYPTITSRTVCVTLSFIVLAAHLLVLQRKRLFARWDYALGELSYAVYIFHILFLGYIALAVKHIFKLSPGWSFMIVFILTGFVTMVFGYLMLRLVTPAIERLRMRLKKAVTSNVDSIYAWSER